MANTHMGGLTPAQLKQFEDEGYLVVDGVVDQTRDLGPVFDEYATLLDEIAAILVQQGEVGSPYTELPFKDRLIRLCEESGRNFHRHFDCSLFLGDLRPDAPMYLGPALFRLITHPRLLDIVESVVGPEIYSNPTQHIRMKLPRRAIAPGNNSALVTRTPWHQDNGAYTVEADAADILTVWMPLNDATLENGCLQVIPRSHRNDLYTHCPGTAGVMIAIPDRQLREEQAVPLPMRASSVLLMTRRTVHSSLENDSYDQVRFSFDMRYQPIGQPTGHPYYPGFVIRSRAQPEAAVRDPQAWAQLWYDARDRLLNGFDQVPERWSSEHPACG